MLVKLTMPLINPLNNEILISHNSLVSYVILELLAKEYGFDEFFIINPINRLEKRLSLYEIRKG